MTSVLETHGLTVRYGGVHALTDVDLRCGLKVVSVCCAVELHRRELELRLVHVDAFAIDGQ